MKENFVLAMFIVGVVGLLGFFGWSLHEYQGKCEAKGGRMISTKYDHFCVPKGQFIEVDD